MIVVFDASVLVYVVTENARAPVDPATGQAVARCRERVEQLIAGLQRDGAKIVVPTPSLAEVLVRAGPAAAEFLRIIGSSRHFRIVPFDQRAAVEFAARQAERIAAGARAPAPTRAKAKFDDQIVAIAAVEGASIIYSDDPDIAVLAGARFETKGVRDLPLPPQDAEPPLLSLMGETRTEEEARPDGDQMD